MRKTVDGSVRAIASHSPLELTFQLTQARKCKTCGSDALKNVTAVNKISSLVPEQSVQVSESHEAILKLSLEVTITETSRSPDLVVDGYDVDAGGRCQRAVRPTIKVEGGPMQKENLISSC
ncbi:hypothetical protein L484_011645 [Morus notabilis]|uniref:Uncharacterized protein n=1 Tax=Morus notabilis TaxID=981085 RepID=W9RF03_9ROSA|nr:hypothetical protein L484_011645 [Morus notabilis]